MGSGADPVSRSRTSAGIDPISKSRTSAGPVSTPRSTAGADGVSAFRASTGSSPAPEVPPAALPPELLLWESRLGRPARRRSTAFWLCLFLGWAGCHRYYVGKKGSGRLYLLTGGLMLLGVIVDLVRIVTGSFEDGFGRPLV